MNRSMVRFAAIAAIALMTSAARAAAVSRDDFQMRTTANLAALCGASDSDPLYTAAVNFCHGFMVGTFRAVATEQAAIRSKRRLFCMPANPPTRQQAVASFVKWAGDQSAQVLAYSPTDGFVAFLEATLPCK